MMKAARQSRSSNGAARDLGAGHHAKGAADGNAQRIDRQRPRAGVRWEVIRNQRIGRRDAASFTNPDANARGEELQKVLGQPAKGRESAPDRQGHSDDPGAVRPVGQPRNGHAERGIERRERDAAKQAELPVIQAEIMFDRFSQDRDDLPVQEIERVGDEEHEQDPRAIARCGRRGLGGARSLAGGGHVAPHGLSFWRSRAQAS